MSAQERLAAELLTHRRIDASKGEITCACGWHGPWFSRHQAAALLPVVEQIAAERAAEELRAIGRAGLAAEPGPHPVRVPVGYLFERAAALTPTAEGDCHE